ncbi:MAG: histidine kinase N-terminal 7TM domain-containing protein [Candidatus Margulisiibacteriota bacterium]|jgi:hypothetical protein
MSLIFYLDLIGKLFAGTALSVLAVYVYLNNRSNLSNRNFALTFGALALWVFSLTIRMFDPDPAHQLLYSRISHFFGAFSIAAFSYTLIVFPKNEDLFPLWKWLIVLPGLIFGGLSLVTDYVLKGYLSDPYPYIYLGTVVTGPLYQLYLAYWVLGPLLSVGFLVWKYFRAQESDRLRIGYLVLAFVIGIVEVGFFNLFLPYVVLIDTTSVGPIVLLFPVFMVAYSIVKFGLFRITPKVAAAEIIESLGGAVYVCDMRGKILYAGTEKFIFSEAVIEKIIEQVIAKGGLQDYRLKIGERWVDISANFLRHGGGLVFIAHDLTDIEQEIENEQRLQQELGVRLQKEQALRRTLACLATVFKKEEIEKACSPAEKLFADDLESLQALEKMVARAEERSRLLDRLEADKAALIKKKKEIEEIQNLGVQRELKMIELKEQIKQLEGSGK